MFNILGDLFDIAVNTVVLPVSVARDVLSLGTNEPSETGENLDALCRSLHKLLEDV